MIAYWFSVSLQCLSSDLNYRDASWAEQLVSTHLVSLLEWRDSRACVSCSYNFQNYSFWYSNLFLYCVRYFGTNINGGECEMSVDECSFVVNLLYKADHSSVRSLILMSKDDWVRCFWQDRIHQTLFEFEPVTHCATQPLQIIYIWILSKYLMKNWELIWLFILIYYLLKYLNMLIYT